MTRARDPRICIFSTNLNEFTVLSNLPMWSPVLKGHLFLVLS